MRHKNLLPNEKKYVYIIRKMLGLRENGRKDCEYYQRASSYLNKDMLIDRIGFDRLRKEYRIKNKADKIPHLNRFKAKGYIYRKGDCGRIIEILNRALSTVLREIKSYPFDHPSGCYFSDESEKAVLYLRECFLLDKNEKTDFEFLCRLFCEEMSINSRYESEKII